MHFSRASEDSSMDDKNLDYFAATYPEIITKENIADSWKDLMLEVFRKRENHLRSLNTLLRKERETGVNWLPGRSRVWAFTYPCPPEDIRIVIVGQDPSPISAHSTGIAFSSDTLSLSTKIVLTELRRDIPTLPPFPPNSGDLKNWSQQGVLLLNSVLTIGLIPPDAVRSYKDEGWEEVVAEIINQLWKRVFAQKPITIYMLWGSSARNLFYNFLIKDRVLPLMASHPSIRNEYGSFIRDEGKPGDFSLVNQKLMQYGLEHIDWSL